MSKSIASIIPKESIESVLNNTYVAGFIKVFIILYAVLAAPKLPAWIAKLFHHSIFQIIIFALIAYTATKDISISILIALAFFVSFHSYTRHLLSKLASKTKSIAVKAKDAAKDVAVKAEHSIIDSKTITSSEKFENLVKDNDYVQYGRLNVDNVADGLSHDEQSLKSDETDSTLPDLYKESLAKHPASNELPGFGGNDYSAV
jgi:hypothetical protein